MLSFFLSLILSFFLSVSLSVSLPFWSPSPQIVSAHFELQNNFDDRQHRLGLSAVEKAETYFEYRRPVLRLRLPAKHSDFVDGVVKLRGQGAARLPVLGCLGLDECVKQG